MLKTHARAYFSATSYFGGNVAGNVGRPRLHVNLIAVETLISRGSKGRSGMPRRFWCSHVEESDPERREILGQQEPQAPRPAKDPAGGHAGQRGCQGWGAEIKESEMGAPGDVGWQTPGFLWASVSTRLRGKCRAALGPNPQSPWPRSLTGSHSGLRRNTRQCLQPLPVKAMGWATGDGAGRGSHLPSSHTAHLLTEEEEEKSGKWALLEILQSKRLEAAWGRHGTVEPGTALTGPAQGCCRAARPGRSRVHTWAHWEGWGQE